MPTGPKGQKRPADVIGISVKVIRGRGVARFGQIGGGGTWIAGRQGAGREDDAGAEGRDRAPGRGEAMAATATAVLTHRRKGLT
jgi:hypothetical protein